MAEVNALWALRNAARKSSDQVSLSLVCRPAAASSNGDISLEHSGTTRDNTLKAPMNDLNPPTLSGMVQVERVAIR